MSKSLVQMVNELFARVDALEKKTACLDHPFFKPIVAVKAAEHKADIENSILATNLMEVVESQKPSRKMCPKCGVKPAYFFHVRTCTGQKEEQKDADKNTVRRRDQGAT